jgi:hypothetical protein
VPGAGPGGEAVRRLPPGPLRDLYVAALPLDPDPEPLNDRMVVASVSHGLAVVSCVLGPKTQLVVFGRRGLSSPRTRVFAHPVAAVHFARAVLDEYRFDPTPYWPSDSNVCPPDRPRLKLPRGGKVSGKNILQAILDRKEEL